MAAEPDHDHPPDAIDVDSGSERDDMSPTRRSNFRPGFDARRGFLRDDSRSLRKTGWQRARNFQRKHTQKFLDLPLLRKLLVVACGIVGVALFYGILLSNKVIFEWLVSSAKKWRDVRGGWVLLWIATFFTAFPPLIGYGMCVTIAGMVYGFPNGWFIAASANVAGSACSFIVYRTMFLDWMSRKAANSRRFAAFAVVLRHDGLKLLCMIRLCPIPYSFSNGAIATVPTVSWLNFTLATAIVSPKLMTHIFIGSRLAALADHDAKMDTHSKIVSYLTIIFSLIISVTTGWVVYRKTKARAAQLEAEDWQHADGPIAEPPGEYSDDINDEDPLGTPLSERGEYLDARK